MAIDIRYPGAVLRPSVIDHPRRPVTLGVCWHWTVGSEQGDIGVLDGPSVDCFLYLAKDGDVYQFLDPRDASWTAMHTANHNSVHIETEGRGEAWTPQQIEAAVDAGDWLSDLFQIPRRKVDPPVSWEGHYGHRDLQGVDGNNHWDSVPDPPGWLAFIDALQKRELPTPPPPPPLPFDAALRLQLDGRLYAGWDAAAGPIAWIARNGLKPSTKAAISFRGPNAAKAAVWRGPEKVTGVCRNLDARFLQPRRKAAS